MLVPGSGCTVVLVEGWRGELCGGRGSLVWIASSGGLNMVE